jgi:hypothetical protein
MRKNPNSPNSSSSFDWIYIHLVGGLEHEFYFPSHEWIILPIDKLIFFKMVKTTNQ